MSRLKLGILGGGQLGRMLIEAMQGEFETFVLDKCADAPACQLADHVVVGDWTSESDVLNFAKNLDVVTIEIESVNANALKVLEQKVLRVYPSSDVVALIQNKRQQKEFYQANDLPTAPFVGFTSLTEDHLYKATFPCVYKAATMGYDGRGVEVCRSAQDLQNFLGSEGLLESFVDFEREISVLVARSHDGQVKTYPVVDMVFNEQANLVEFVSCPSSLPRELQEQAQSIAERVVESMNLVGVLAVEMFVTKDQQILINESAPRPHNSGHQTIEGNECSQYAQLVRILSHQELGSTQLVSPCVQMNLLGESGFEGIPVYKNLEAVQNQEGVFVHLYGKKQTKPFRKMGHVTVLANTLTQAVEKAKKIQKSLKVESV